jgi:hypothetical protein
MSLSAFDFLRLLFLCLAAPLGAWMAHIFFVDSRLSRTMQLLTDCHPVYYGLKLRFCHGTAWRIFDCFSKMHCQIWCCVYLSAAQLNCALLYLRNNVSQWARTYDKRIWHFPTLFTTDELLWWRLVEMHFALVWIIHARFCLTAETEIFDWRFVSVSQITRFNTDDEEEKSRLIKTTCLSTVNFTESCSFVQLTPQYAQVFECMSVAWSISRSMQV